MKVGLVVNSIETEEAVYTTSRLGQALVNKGHEVWTMGVGDLAYDPDESIRARAVRPQKTRYASSQSYLREVQSNKTRMERITVDEIDVLMLRNDPSTEKGRRDWAKTAAVDFGRMAMRRGVIVLNDPVGLSKAANKMYFQSFPEEVRPQTLITRNRDEIKRFAKDMEGHIVLKPLQGSGGEGVFLVRPGDVANLNQMIEAVSRDGYVIAQEYLPRAEEGDTRLFLMNAQPLRHKGRFAAFRRIRRGGDMRSNVHAGGVIGKAMIDDDALRLAEIVRPKLVQDGMFLVGLDIVGDKLMEINVFSPGGLGSAQKQEGVNFTEAVVHALEQKVQYAQYYRRSFVNQEMATL